MSRDYSLINWVFDVTDLRSDTLLSVTSQRYDMFEFVVGHVCIVI